MVSQVHQELYLILFALAISFSFLSTLHMRYLITIIIVLLFSYVAYIHLDAVSNERLKDGTSKEDSINKDIQGRREINSSIFYNDRFPKKLKYITKNNELMDILTNIRFVRKFSDSRYGDLILNANKLMKIYIYMLVGRYDINTYIPMFTDIRDNSLEIMQSLIMIIPKRLKHTYGLDTYGEIDRSINRFTEETQEMLDTVSRYARIHLGEEYVIDTMYDTYHN